MLELWEILLTENEQRRRNCSLFSIDVRLSQAGNMTFGKQVAKGHENQYVTIEGLACPEVIFDPGRRGFDPRLPLLFSVTYFFLSAFFTCQTVLNDVAVMLSASKYFPQRAIVHT